MRGLIAWLVAGAALLGLPMQDARASDAHLTLVHFDVNDGAATLIISPGGHGVLIDSGARGRGHDPISEFLERARREAQLQSLDYTIVTHYDDDHLGGMDELYRRGWYPRIAAYDRGNSYLPPFDARIAKGCAGVQVEDVENLAPWGGAPARWCPIEIGAASCGLLQYLRTVEQGGKRRELRASDVIGLDGGVQIVVLVANARDIDGDSVEVFFEGRRLDCGQDDLSIGLLLKYGNFRYLIAGDLTGAEDARVADVEELIKDDAVDLDVYHVNAAGDWTSSSLDFMSSIHPSVAIVSNGGRDQHPVAEVVSERLLGVQPQPDLYLSNRNQQERAWQADPAAVADDDLRGYDGLIAVHVWKNTYNVTRWRNAGRLDRPGRSYAIKARLPSVAQGAR